jgi:hypothetical protein
MSALSGQTAYYARAANFAMNIDRALLVLKRAALKLPSASNLSADELANSARALGELLWRLACLVESRTSAPAEVLNQIPAGFLARLSSASEDTPTRMSPTELRLLADRLSSGDPAAITKHDIDVLEDIAVLADRDATETIDTLNRP